MPSNPAEHSKIGSRTPRSYNSPVREEAAARTRLAIVQAAKDAFEEYGWSAARVASIAEGAGVSQKTVEAVFGTKSALLRATIDFAIRGDVGSRPMLQRPAVLAMEAAPDAVTMLSLHAAHLRRIHTSSARLTWVVEQAARADENVARLWREMTQNRRVGVTWAAGTLVAKEDFTHIAVHEVEAVFWVALEGGTYRLLVDQVGLSDDEYELWILGYYLRMFGLRRPPTTGLISNT